MEKEIAEQINSRLKAAIDASINQQIAENNPPETIQTIERLQTEGFTKEEAYTLVGHLVSLEIAEELAGKQGFNLERFVVALELLPEPFAKPKQTEDDED